MIGDINRRASDYNLKSAEEDIIEDVNTYVEHELSFKEEYYIRCKSCRFKITSLDHIIAINGEHKHTFTNPAGYTFEIGCFSSAAGCLVYGIPSLDYTWFKGFCWNFALCGNCASHLGWHYHSSDENFFGLILKRLFEDVKIH
jgi:hypothetical protein